MKKFMKLIPALAMLLIATTLVSTATFAWFSMNNTVEAVNMQVKAKAEQGLLINEVPAANDANWDNSATAKNLPAYSLVPTSTTDGSVWFHANSKAASDEAGATAADTASTNLAGVYEELDSLLVANTAAVNGNTPNAENNVYYRNDDGVTGYDDAKDTAFYVMYKYYLKVSNGSGINNLGRTAGAQNVAIKEVKATLPGTPATANLDKALRVGIKIGGKMYIYAPVYGANTTSDPYFVVVSETTTNNVQTITTEEVLPFATNKVTYTALTSLPGINGDAQGKGTEVDIYVWFEGEDDNCQSDQLVSATLDDIVIDVTFSLETIGATAPDAITKNEF